MPNYVLMHGDFWKGNILIAPKADFPAAGTRWNERFVIIDWPGSITQGYAMFDLIRLAQSFRLSSNALKRDRSTLQNPCRVHKNRMARRGNQERTERDFGRRRR
jgi:hypothetical protein